MSKGRTPHMASRQDWLEAGLEILANSGARDMTLENLMEKMGLTKGSFYHHFKGMPAFKTALMQHYEEQLTAQYIEEAEAGAPPASEKLRRLLERVATESRDDPEAAIRSWALQDAEVAETQARVDRARLEYLESVWLEHSGDAREARVMGQLLYVILVGSTHVLPPIAGDDLREVYKHVLRDVLA
ncbi:TetR/AcrR family transcriptional regulator (plasmid) [Streptomycetaceae bacterium NBC_01309]